MKQFSLARLIGRIGFVVVATAAGTAMAAPLPNTTQPAPSDSGQPTPTTGRTPATCDSTGQQGASTAETPSTGTSSAGDPYGLEALVADALSKVCLSDDQRSAIEQLGKDVSPKAKELADANHAFITALAEQVRSGSVDQSTVKTQIDALVKAHDEASPVFRKALEDLHGILDSGQRAAFVDALEASMKDKRDASARWFHTLGHDLGLSDDQKQRIKDVLSNEQPDIESQRDLAKAVFDAFKGDQFSTDKVAPQTDVMQKVRSRAEEMVKGAALITDILTPDQRSKLADAIEGRATEGTPSEETGTVQQGLYLGYGGGYRRGYVRGWGGGYYGGGAYRSVRTGYAAGYPFVGGYAPGLW